MLRSAEDISRWRIIVRRAAKDKTSTVKSQDNTGRDSVRAQMDMRSRTMSTVTAPPPPPLTGASYPATCPCCDPSVAATLSALVGTRVVTDRPASATRRTAVKSVGVNNLPRAVSGSLDRQVRRPTDAAPSRYRHPSSTGRPGL